MSPTELANILDGYGVVLINFKDAETGEEVPGLDWVQVSSLLEAIWFEESSPRATALRLASALAQIKATVTPDDTSLGEPESVLSDVVHALETARSERPEVQVTSGMVEAFGAAFFDPAMVWDRARVEGALASALRAR